MEIRSRYFKVDRVQLSFDPELTDADGNYVARSMTQQQFKNECDIRWLLKRYRETGTPLPVPTGSFEDVSTVADFQTHMNAVARTKEYFDSLPATTRARFANDPMQLVAFLNDDANRAEAVKLGLLEASKVESATPLPSEVKKPAEAGSGESESV